jgi:hypothetical protein
MAHGRPTIRLLLAVCLTLGAGIAKAQTSQATESHGMEYWIARLTDDSWKTREEATERLIALGEDVVPRLHQLAQTTDDGELRTRASAALGQIAENRVVGMSLITAHLRQVPASQALAELARQARAPLLTDPANLLAQKNMKPVSLNVDHRPFWEVMESLCAQTDLEVTGISRHNRDSDWLNKPIVLSGPLLIRANALVRISTAHLKPAGDVSQEFNISLSAFAEPKLKVLDYSTSLKLLEVVDERGNSFIPPPDKNGPANIDVFGNAREGNTSHWEMGASLHYPKGSGNRIVRFRASTAVLVQTGSGVLEAPLSGSKGVTRTLGGLRVSIRNLDAGRCELSIYRDGRDDAEWYRVRMQLNASEAVLMDDKERIVARSQSSMDADESPDNQQMELRLRFAKEGGDEVKDGRKKGTSEAAKLVWSFPTETRELTLPFEFHNLPVP